VTNRTARREFSKEGKCDVSDERRYLPEFGRTPTVKGMNEHVTPNEAATENQALPLRIRAYVNGRGISDAVIDRQLLGWNGHRITIPIHDRDGVLVSFKLARDPADSPTAPKMLYSQGATAELYGWEQVLRHPAGIVVCEGEFDRLVLESHQIPAVTSTGGAGVFRSEWAEDLKKVREVFVCFDRDRAGYAGARQVARLVPHARVVELPAEVGDGGDISDFFVRLKRSREEFLQLLGKARSAPPEVTEVEPSVRTPSETREPGPAVAELKSAVNLETVVGRYLPLRQVGQQYRGRCPFHEDHNPSFVVFPATQTFHCFGCQLHGDVIDFVQRKEGLSFREALLHLKQDHGTT
jgi:DNA primase